MFATLKNTLKHIALLSLHGHRQGQSQGQRQGKRQSKRISRLLKTSSGSGGEGDEAVSAAAHSRGLVLAELIGQLDQALVECAYHYFYHSRVPLL